MRQCAFPILFGATLATFFGAFCAWHSPRRKKLTREEIDRYIGIIEKLPAREGSMQSFIPRLRAWAEGDDGKPVFMLNLIRFYSQLRTFAGAPEFSGTPEEANAYYERSITPLWLSHAAYPILAGALQGATLLNFQPEKAWDRAVVCRYPSRRAFLELLCDPSYGPMEPYKFIALEIDLVPVSGDRVIPDLRFIVGPSLLALFLAVNWLRSARNDR
jgi:hypothetical protein